MKPTSLLPPLLATALFLPGCKGCESPPPAPAVKDVRMATPSAPSPAPAPAPAPGSALSYLLPLDLERCAWVRRPLPSGEPITVFDFDAPCDQSQLAWSPDGTQGLVHTWPVGEGARERVWLVDFAAKKGRPLDLQELPNGTGAQGPDKPYIDKVGFDPQGRAVALVADVYVGREAARGEDGQPSLSFEGQRYRVPPGDGLPGLALAYRLEGEHWKRFEVKASTYQADDAREARALEAFAGLALREPFVEETTPGEKAPASASTRLDAAFPEVQDPGQWMEWTLPGGKLYFRGARADEEASHLSATVPLRWEQEGTWVEPEGLQASDGAFLHLQREGDLLLVSVRGDPRSVSVFDARTRKNLVSVPGAESATFWPGHPRP